MFDLIVSSKKIFFRSLSLFSSSNLLLPGLSSIQEVASSMNLQEGTGPNAGLLSAPTKMALKISQSRAL